MRWKTGRRSSNVEDRRGSRVGAKTAGGGVLAIIVTLVALYLGVDPAMLLQGVGVTSVQSPPEQSAPRSAEEDELADFVAVVLGDTEDTWHALFKQAGKQYREPVLVLFSGSVQSACGFAEAATGPFYCPADYKVYIDLSFYRDLKERFKAPGDFAQAYVIAHEVAHHVQNLLGISGKVQKARRDTNDAAESNRLSVKLELQADCLAGVWAHHAHKARNILERGDLAEALGAASAIGDDRLQKQARGRVVPDSFTHGSSAQRVRWFKRGIESGSVARCNTFEAARL